MSILDVVVGVNGELPKNTPLGRSASSFAGPAAVRYTCVAFLASGPPTREGLRASPAYGETRGVSR